MKKLTKREMKHIIGGDGPAIGGPFLGTFYTCYDFNGNYILSGCYIATPDGGCAYCKSGDACYHPMPAPLDPCL